MFSLIFPLSKALRRRSCIPTLETRHRRWSLLIKYGVYVLDQVLSSDPTDRRIDKDLVDIVVVIIVNG